MTELQLKIEIFSQQPRENNSTLFSLATAKLEENKISHVTMENGGL